MQLLDGKLFKSDLNAKARGGTELLAERMVRGIQPEVLNDFQIIFSRLKHDLLDDKYRVLYCHDLADDPETNFLANSGWEKFHKIVFVSHWQMNQFASKYNIPPSKLVVLQNSIEPFENNLIERHQRTGRLVIGYWSTPHRGLEILVPVFDLLAQEFDIELRIFSSFDLYGWEQRDQPYEELFQRCREHPKIKYSKSIDNDQLRRELEEIDIMAYPSIWQETSCLCLIEAMSAGIMSVHSNLAALPETSANLTLMYPYHEDLQEHAAQFYYMLRLAVENMRTEETYSRLLFQKSYADIFYNWNVRKNQWTSLLSGIAKQPKFPAKSNGPKWTYSTE